VSARASLSLAIGAAAGNQNAALIAKNLRLLLVPAGAAFLAKCTPIHINRVSLLYGHTARRRFIKIGLNLFAGINKTKMRTNRFWPPGYANC
jgi:hypothetical protein